MTLDAARNVVKEIHVASISIVVNTMLVKYSPAGTLRDITVQ